MKIIKYGFRRDCRLNVLNIQIVCTRRLQSRDAIDKVTVHTNSVSDSSLGPMPNVIRLHIYIVGPTCKIIMI